ncbi:hypothetical protein GMORB2_4399 [Geosmithia morbida]|uniref:Uncharacterized protein n=1 Tax=Geosmithia morbida TaxID=1094350 RepID=A0A9P5CXW4_9HYPO|nr:uncharacterized protein GMORB2_4399 [Geosmithia morbida]KAF4119733.1 hypothetical protein GMORB2_4399 [Geosmithia morbida]
MVPTFSAASAAVLGLLGGSTFAPRTSILNATSRILAPKIGLRSRSPAARADQLSFFTENTAQQLTGYSPDQIELILKQREEVQSTIEEKKLRTLTTSSPDDETDPARPPWVPKLSKECTYTACPRCRPGYAARSFLSIDAVANGEVLPTSALGFGFHPIGERPVVDAEILKTIGIRVPDPSPSNTPIQHTFLCAEEFSTGEPEDPSKMQPVIRGDDGEGEEGEIHSCKESTGGDVSNTSRSPPPPPIVSRNLKHASTCSKTLGDRPLTSESGFAKDTVIMKPDCENADDPQPNGERPDQSSDDSALLSLLQMKGSARRRWNGARDLGIGTDSSRLNLWL